MSRRLIPNVLKLYENPAENYMFPSCMESVMGRLMKKNEIDFLFFLASQGTYLHRYGLSQNGNITIPIQKVCVYDNFSRCRIPDY